MSEQSMADRLAQIRGRAVSIAPIGYLATWIPGTGWGEEQASRITSLAHEDVPYLLGLLDEARAALQSLRLVEGDETPDWFIRDHNERIDKALVKLGEGA
jgi:hypothetical protein